MEWGLDHPSPHYYTAQETPLPPGKRKERELYKIGELVAEISSESIAVLSFSVTVIN